MTRSRRSGRDEPDRGDGRRRIPRLAPLRSAARRAATRSSRSTTSRPAAMENIEHLRRPSPASSSSSPTWSTSCPSRAPSTRAALREPGEPARVPRACRSRRSTSARSARATRSTSRARTTRGSCSRRRARSTATRWCTRSPRPTAATSNPVGPRAVYDEAKRFAETLTMTYHRLYDLPTRDRAHLQHLRPAACARPTVASSPTSWCRRSTGKPLTVYGDGTQTRSFCYVDDEVRGILALLRLRRRRPGEHRQPGRVHDAGAGRRSCIEVTGLDVRRSSFEPLPDRRPDPAPARHHAGAGSCSAGNRRSQLREGLDAHARLVPGGARARGRA